MILIIPLYLVTFTVLRPSTKSWIIKTRMFRQSLPKNDPEWEEMKRQKDRQARREEDLEMLHNSMFG